MFDRTDKRVVTFVYKVGKAGASEVSYSLVLLIRFVFNFLCLLLVALSFGFDASRGLTVPAKQAQGVMGSRIGESRNRWPGRPHRRKSPEFSLTFYPLSPAILSASPSQHACDRQQRQKDLEVIRDPVHREATQSFHVDSAEIRPRVLTYFLSALARDSFRFFDPARL